MCKILSLLYGLGFVANAFLYAALKIHLHISKIGPLSSYMSVYMIICKIITSQNYITNIVNNKVCSKT